MKLIKRSLTVLICIFCVSMWIGAQAAFSAMSNYDLEHKINELNERLEKAEPPHSMRGMPIAMIVAGCMALAFLGFAGLKI